MKNSQLEWMKLHFIMVQEDNRLEWKQGLLEGLKYKPYTLLRRKLYVGRQSRKEPCKFRMI